MFFGSKKDFWVSQVFGSKSACLFQKIYFCSRSCLGYIWKAILWNKIENWQGSWKLKINEILTWIMIKICLNKSLLLLLWTFKHQIIFLRWKCELISTCFGQPCSCWKCSEEVSGRHASQRHLTYDHMVASCRSHNIVGTECTNCGNFSNSEEYPKIHEGTHPMSCCLFILWQRCLTWIQFANASQPRS